jgi:hypothetical protein
VHNPPAAKTGLSRTSRLSHLQDQDFASQKSNPAPQTFDPASIYLVSAPLALVSATIYFVSAMI